MERQHQSLACDAAGGCSAAAPGSSCQKHTRLGGRCFEAMPGSSSASQLSAVSDPTADAGCDPPPHPPNRNFRAKPAAGGISHLLPASAWLCPGALGNLLLTQASPVFLHPVQVPAGSFSCFYVIHFREIKDPNLGIPCSYTSTAPSQAKVLQPHRAFCPSASL